MSSCFSLETSSIGKHWASPLEILILRNIEVTTILFELYVKCHGILYNHELKLFFQQPYLVSCNSLISQIRKQKHADHQIIIWPRKKHQGPLFSSTCFTRASFSTSIGIKIDFMLSLIVYPKEYIIEIQRITCFYLIICFFTTLYFKS